MEIIKQAFQFSTIGTFFFFFGLNASLIFLLMDSELNSQQSLIFYSSAQKRILCKHLGTGQFCFQKATEFLSYFWGHLGHQSFPVLGLIKA